MNNPQLIDYIRQQFAVGISKEEVRKALLINNWQMADIDEAFASIVNPSIVPQPVQPAQSTIVSTQNGNGTLISVGQLFSDSWDLYKQRVSVLAALLFIPYAFLFASQMLTASGNTIAGVIVSLICVLLFIPLFAAIISAVSQGSGFSDSLRQGVRLFFPLLWVGILMWLVVMGGFIMLIIPAFLMAIWFSLIGFTFVVEGKRGLNAFLQSREYTRGYCGAILGRMFVVGLLVFISTSIATAVASLLFGKITGTLVYYVFMMFTTPFSLICSYNIYKNLTLLKPTLAATTPTSGRGFLIASAILGLIAPIIIVIGVVTMLVLVGKANTTSTTTPSSLPAVATPGETPLISSVATLATTSYVNTTAGYRITSPAGWQAQNTVANGKDNETFVEPAPNPSQANIAIVAAQNTNTAMNTRAGLDTAVQKVIAVYQIVLPDFKLLSNTASSVGSAPASLLLFTSKNSSGVQIESLAFFTVGGGHFYETAVQATAADWNTYEGLFRSVIASFSFVP